MFLPTRAFLIGMLTGMGLFLLLAVILSARVEAEPAPPPELFHAVIVHVGAPHSLQTGHAVKA